MSALARHRAALLLAALAAPLAVQVAAQVDDPRGADHARHLRTVYAERLAELQVAWADAAPQARARLETYLAASLGSGAPAGAWPDLVTLSAGVRVLAGDDPGVRRTGSLDALADALDQLVVPGCVEPAGPGERDRGEPVVVRVYPADARVAALSRHDVDAALYWVASDGREVLARAEHVARAAFAPPGFDVFVRAPRGAPGAWRAVLELRAGERAVRGRPVPVEAAAGFRARFQRAYERLTDTDFGAQHLVLEDLRRLLGYGQRSACVDPPSRRLASLLSDEAAGTELAVTLYAVPADRPLLERRLFWLHGSPAARVLLVLLSPSQLDPEAVFAGPSGAAWLALAAGRDVALAATALGNEDGPVLADILAQARALAPEAEVGLVARGDAVRRLYLRLLIERELDPDFLALSAPSARTGSLLPRVPTWIASPEAHPAASGEGDGERDDGAVVRRVQLATTPFLAEPELPALLGPWLDERAALRR